VGCSSNAARMSEMFGGGDERAAKRELRRLDWSLGLEAAGHAVHSASPGASWFERAKRVAALAASGGRAAHELIAARCERGAAIVIDLGFGHAVAKGVSSLDERWDGRGQPQGLSGSGIPILSRVMALAQTMEVFSVIDGPAAAIDIAHARSGSWFDPMLVEVTKGMEPELARLATLDDWGLQHAVREVEPGDAMLLAGPGTLDRIASAFAQVVDAKSPYTAHHSRRVTEYVVKMADHMGLPAGEIVDLQRAALLHDLGKLSVPNSVLDKPGPLTTSEWETMRLHPYYTQRILDRVRAFQNLAFVSSSHHERLDGRGYFRGLRGPQVPFGARILAVADVYEALTSERPYRPALAPEEAFSTMERDRGTGLAADCMDALIYVVRDEEREASAA
jgi:HD-GYP domain-containing protein (c-di-GMP phosphodiesterase class II)